MPATNRGPARARNNISTAPAFMKMPAACLDGGLPSLKLRYRPEKVVLHVPPMDELSIVKVNSEKRRVKSGDQIVLKG